MKRALFLCAVAMLAGSTPVAAQTVTLNCSFKAYEAGKFISNGTAQFAVDYSRRTVDGRPAHFLSDRVVWDEVGANGSGTTTYYRKDGRYHNLIRAPDNHLSERYGTCQ